MAFQTWLAFCAIAAINIFSPGPAILLAISNGATKGLFSAFCQALGNAIGLFVVSLVSIFGVGAILATSAMAFSIVKLAGATYLIFLGIKQIRSRNETAYLNANEQQTGSNTKVFLEGFTIAVTNPKAILFFIALFPLFLDQQRDIISQFLIMTTSFQVISIASLTGYALISRSAKKLFQRKSFMRRFKTVTGSIFIVLGLGLLKVSAAQR